MPLIKQSHNNYCGVASTLQILYALDSSQIDRTSDDLKDQMDALAPSIMDGDSGSRYKIVYNVLVNDNLEYEVKTSTASGVMASLQSGYPCIAHLNPAVFTRYQQYGTNVGDGHYCAVIGYDPVSDFFVFSDCSYLPGNFGIYLVHPSDYDSANKGMVRT